MDNLIGVYTVFTQIRNSFVEEYNVSVVLHNGQRQYFLCTSCSPRSISALPLSRYRRHQSPPSSPTFPANNVHPYTSTPLQTHLHNPSPLPPLHQIRPLRRRRRYLPWRQIHPRLLRNARHEPIHAERGRGAEHWHRGGVGKGAGDEGGGVVCGAGGYEKER